MIESLAFTIGAARKLIGRFDAFRKKRNMSSYETGGTISELECLRLGQTTGARHHGRRQRRDRDH